MTPSERHQRVSDLFNRVCELPVTERAVFLDRECKDDPTLRAEVEALLPYDSGAGVVANAEHELAQGATVPRAAVGQAGDSPKRSQSSAHQLSFDGYAIVKELHGGGQGVVYQAIQKATKSLVAIKVLREGLLASDSSKKRFEREIEIAAQFKHPNIVAIFNSGTTPDGARYCVMEYIAGLPLDSYIREKKLPLEETLRLFGKVCGAVQYAHQRGVIHRDLKPSNVLVNAEGNPKVLDFGLAKLLAAPVETVVSVTQQLIGTLPYMSPEQASGTKLDEIDTRTDIYALGVILYELLTGHYPYPVVGNMVEVLKNITEKPPTPPSQGWTGDSGITKRSSKHVRAGQCPIDDELQTVVLKTLSKERERRYQSAGDLARDLENYLSGKPIEAKRDSGWYVFKKAVSRHRAKTAIALSMIALAGAIYGYHRVRLAAEHRCRQAEQLISLAQLSEKRAEDEQAFEQYTEAQALDPSNSKSFHLAALNKMDEYVFRRKYANRDSAPLVLAEQLCDRALSLAPEKASLWNLRAKILLNLGKLDLAEEACKKAITLDAAKSYAHATLAKTHAVQNRFDEARRVAFEGSLRVPDDAHSDFDDDIWQTLAALYLYAGDPRALNALNSAEKVSRRDTRTLILLARLYLTIPEHVEPKKALRAAEFAERFTTFKDDPRFKRVLAQAQLANEQNQEAVESALKALDGRDEPAYCHVIAAIALAKLGKLAEARQHLSDALASRPEQFNSGDVIVRVDMDYLWIDTLAEFNGLREQAETLLQPSTP